MLSERVPPGSNPKENTCACQINRKSSVQQKTFLLKKAGFLAGAAKISKVLGLQSYKVEEEEP